MTISEALLRGCSTVVKDSRGMLLYIFYNLIAYVDYADRIYVPIDAHIGKKRLLKALNTVIIEVSNRIEAAEKVEKDSTRRYVGHRVNPFFIEVIKNISLGLEIAKVLERVDYIVVPAGSATLAIGVWKGFKELFDAKLIDYILRLVLYKRVDIAPWLNMLN